MKALNCTHQITSEALKKIIGFLLFLVIDDDLNKANRRVGGRVEGL